MIQKRLSCIRDSNGRQPGAATPTTMSGRHRRSSPPRAAAPSSPGTSSSRASSPTPTPARTTPTPCATSSAGATTPTGRSRSSRITPGHVGDYLTGLITLATPTKKLRLAALRKFFDVLVVRHVVVLNPAASVRAERYAVVEGKTPEISAKQARNLLKSIDTANLVGLRDRAIIAVLIYTAARVGAVAKLTLKSLKHDGTQHSLRFSEKGGKSREIPVRHDLEQFLLGYIEAAKITEGPLFRTAVRRTQQLTTKAMSGIDICRMMKRRLKAAGLPGQFSPHSFRVATVTDLLEQNVPLEDVQHLAGHADPRTTRLYDRRRKKVTRNIVERISI